MKDKQFDPARTNEVAPAPGIAAVSTHNPQEEDLDRAIEDQLEEDVKEKEKEKGKGKEKE